VSTNTGGDPQTKDLTEAMTKTLNFASTWSLALLVSCIYEMASISITDAVFIRASFRECTNPSLAI
jgi:hypothetical protein